MERKWTNWLDNPTTESKLFSTGSFEVNYVSGSEETGAEKTTASGCVGSPFLILLSFCCHLCRYFGKKRIYQASSLAAYLLEAAGYYDRL